MSQAAESRDEPGLIQQVTATFRGPNRAVHILVFVEGAVFFVLALLCAWRFFQVDTTELQIVYATSVIFWMLLLVLVKVWYITLLHRNEILRRIDRLERKLDR